jgi:hypothetical protein
MVTAQEIAEWVELYVQAWHSNTPDKIGTLFTDDADYYTEPFAEPWVGREEIVREWVDRKDEPDTWSFEFDVLAVHGRLGIVRGHTTYFDPPREYWNLWEVTLDDAQCERFVEWWMKKK